MFADSIYIAKASHLKSYGFYFRIYTPLFLQINK